MRSQGIPPYHIVDEELVNKMSDDIVICALSAGAAFNAFRIAACGTAALPAVGLLFDGDQCKVAAHGEVRVCNGRFVKKPDSASFRNDGNTGVRCYAHSARRCALIGWILKAAPGVWSILHLPGAASLRLVSLRWSYLFKAVRTCSAMRSGVSPLLSSSSE